MRILREYDGYFGAFTRDTARGAWPNGTRIRKAVSEPGDSTPTGTEGTVLGSLGHPDVGLFYFVEWDNKPRIAVGTISAKLALAEAKQETVQ